MKTEPPEKIVLLAKSSSGEPYMVEFLTQDGCVLVFCYCAAGELRMMCKHKRALITGDKTMLFNPEQAHLISVIHAWPEFARLKARLEKFDREIVEIDAEKAALSKREKAAKAILGRDLTVGKYA